MADLAIDRALEAVRGAIDDWGDYEPNDPRLGPDRLAFLDGLRAVLAILEAARACDAAWGTPGLYDAQQALHAAIQGGQ